MSGYTPKEYGRLVSAKISPVTAAALMAVTPKDRLERLVKNVPNSLIKERILNELADLNLTASFYQTLRGTNAPGGATSQAEHENAPTGSGEGRDEWISVAESAQILGMTERTVRNYIRKGDLEARKKDQKSYLLAKTDVEALALSRDAA
ncbi:hypothetical protein GCM10027417_24030 [Glutamicibacter endophyticus]